MQEVRIGVVDVSKELTVEIDGPADEVMNSVSAALKKESGMLWLTDTKGKQVGIPVTKLAYVEIDPDKSVRSVGFGVR